MHSSIYVILYAISNYICGADLQCGPVGEHHAVVAGDQYEYSRDA